MSENIIAKKKIHMKLYEIFPDLSRVTYKKFRVHQSIMNRGYVESAVNCICLYVSDCIFRAVNAKVNKKHSVAWSLIKSQIHNLTTVRNEK